MKTMPAVGSWVRLIKGRSKKAARVTEHYKDIAGGLRVDRRLDGFQSWNRMDVEPAEPNPEHPCK
jgi:hypothetical protein